MKRKLWQRDMPKAYHLTKRKNWKFQIEGYFTMKNTKTGQIWKGKGFSKVFRNIKDARKHYEEAKHDAMFYAGGTNWSVVKSSYRRIRWRKLKRKKEKKK